MRNDLAIKVRIIRARMNKITTARAWERHKEESENGARKDQLGDNGIEDGPGKRGERWEMDWEDILQEEEQRRAKENGEEEEEEEYMVFGGLDEEEAEVVHQASRQVCVREGKEDDEVSITQEDESGWERMSVAQGKGHWESNMMKRIVRERREKAAARRMVKRSEAFTRGPLPKGVVEVQERREEEEEGPAAQDGPRTEEEEEFRMSFPGYNWRNIEGRKFAVKLGEGPKELGRRKEHNKKDKKSTVMTCGVGLFDPMRWYLQELVWSPPGDDHRGTSHIELALDFEAATGVPLKPPGVTGKRTLQQKGALFQDAARRTAELCGGKEAPGEKQKKCRALTGLKWPEMGGWECRAQLLKARAVMNTLAAARMPQLGAAGWGVRAYEVAPDWHVSPGPPIWSDRKKEEASQQPRHHRGIVRTGVGTGTKLDVEEKVEKHNKEKNKDRHCACVGGEGSELSCSKCGYWAPRRQLSAFLQEQCAIDGERGGAPEDLSKKERKAWRDRATQLRHARHEAGKKGGEAPGVRGTKASRSCRAPIKKRAARRSGGHGITINGEDDGGSGGASNAGAACTCAIALSGRPGTEAKKTLAAKDRGKKGRENDAENGSGDERGTSNGDQGITGNSGAGKKNGKEGTRKRVKSGRASGARAAAKRSEEEEVGKNGDAKSSNNERKNEDGGSLSLSAKAETGRPPGRPRARRARCRHEVGRAGNKVGK
jgi:hypothetical protein